MFLIICEIALFLDIFYWKIDRDLQRKLSQFHLILLIVLTNLKELFCANAHTVSTSFHALPFFVCILLLCHWLFLGLLYK